MACGMFECKARPFKEEDTIFFGVFYCVVFAEFGWECGVCLAL